MHRVEPVEILNRSGCSSHILVSSLHANDLERRVLNCLLLKRSDVCDSIPTDKTRDARSSKSLLLPAVGAPTDEFAAVLSLRQTRNRQIHIVILHTTRRCVILTISVYREDFPASSHCVDIVLQMGIRCQRHMLVMRLCNR
jgi:hypothetical protein